MPPVSLAQSRYIGKVKRGRPRQPVDAVTKDALWKRAQRADKRPPNRGMVRHHGDHAYGRKSPKVSYITRAQHNRLHKKGKLRRKVA